MTNTQNNTPTTDKIKGWELRQEDTGWGRAFAHVIPFYPLINACQRDTITPACMSSLDHY